MDGTQQKEGEFTVWVSGAELEDYGIKNEAPDLGDARTVRMLEDVLQLFGVAYGFTCALAQTEVSFLPERDGWRIHLRAKEEQMYCAVFASAKDAARWNRICSSGELYCLKGRYYLYPASDVQLISEFADVFPLSSAEAVYLVEHGVRRDV